MVRYVWYSNLNPVLLEACTGNTSRTNRSRIVLYLLVSTGRKHDEVIVDTIADLRSELNRINKSYSSVGLPGS